MNIVNVFVFIATLSNLVFGIYDHNIFAAFGWGVASLYVALSIAEELIEIYTGLKNKL
jgi:hypothetical protein